MNKKSIILFVIIVAICIALGVFFVVNNSKENNNSNKNTNISNKNESNRQEADNRVENDSNGSIRSKADSLVIYFSATGTTEKIANDIKEITNSDIIEIIPKEEYTEEDLNYNEECRANREQKNPNSRPEIANTIDVSNYEVIYLGYPIWWGDVPKIILTLLETTDFNGKTIIPFCTSGGSSIAQSTNTLKSYKDINWNDGKTFYHSTSKQEVEKWIKEK